MAFYGVEILKPTKSVTGRQPTNNDDNDEAGRKRTLKLLKIAAHARLVKTRAYYHEKA